MAKRETIEDVIRMAVRVQERMRKDGVGLHWTCHFGAIPGKEKDTDMRKPQRRARSASGGQ